MYVSKKCHNWEATSPQVLMRPERGENIQVNDEEIDRRLVGIVSAVLAKL